MGIASLLWLAVKRLRSRWGLTLLSLTGVVLAIGVITSIPIFTQAVAFLALEDELKSMGDVAHRPPFAVRFYFRTWADQPLSLAQVREMERVIARTISDKVGLPIASFTTRVETFPLVLRPTSGDLRYGNTEDVDIRELTLTVLSQVADRIVVQEGESFGDIRREDGRIAVWVQEALANETGVHVGEEYDLLHRRSGNTIPIYIAGFWRAKDADDVYWYDDPATSMRDTVLVSGTVYEAHVESLLPEKTGYDTWYVVFDEKALAAGRVETAAKGLEIAANTMHTILPGMTMGYSPLAPLRRYVQRRAALLVLLVGFSVPALGLLLYFLSLISTVAVSFQREEAAILASRGGDRSLILALSALEALLLIALGLPLGLALGDGLARVMGYSLSFMTFAQRPSLPVSLAGVDWRLLAGGLGMLLAARMIPSWQAARESVVTHLRMRSRPVAMSLLGKVALDVPLILASLYAYMQLRARGTLGITSWDPSGDPFQYPLLLLAPSLFVFGGCLVLAHLFPLLSRPVDALSGRLRNFPVYFGLRQLARTGEQYTSALFLVFVCLSLGAFYSSTALSLDQWLSDRVYYQAGADLTFKQGYAADDLLTELQDGGRAKGAWLLPVSEYLQLPGVQAATRVGDVAAVATLTRRLEGRFLGIDRLDFANVAFFREDFSQVPVNELMNRLGMYENGVLVPRQFLRESGLMEGQKLTLEVKAGLETREVSLLVVGTFDYFPTMYPQKGPVFVGNLDYLFEQLGGLFPHSVWLRTDPAAEPNRILTQLEEMGVIVVGSTDTRLEIVRDEERVERVGFFGVLSTGFVSSSILSMVGLLVYTYASLQRRLQELSILRATGTPLRGILLGVGVEYGGVIAYGVLGGTAVGATSSNLFVPFFHFTSDPALLAPPFVPQIDWVRIICVAAVFAFTLITSQIIILRQVTRKDVFQLLRMGQRE